MFLFISALISGAAFACPCVRTDFELTSSLDKAPLYATLSEPLQKDAAVKGMVLMIVGSGKADRDETVPAKLTTSGKDEKLFAQISDALNAAGFITLRYDKRGVKLKGDSKVIDEKLWKTADITHLKQDARDAAQWLLRRYPKRPLALLGHSEGTIISAQIAGELPLKGLLLLGTSGRNYLDLLRFQLVDAPLAENPKEDRPTLEKEFEEALTMIKTSKDELAPDGKPMNYYREGLKLPSNSEVLAPLKMEISIFQGEDDVQTPLIEAQTIARARKVELKTYPGLGHGFSKRKEGKPTVGPIEDHVLADIVQAALKTVSSSPSKQ